MTDAVAFGPRFTPLDASNGTCEWWYSGKDASTQFQNAGLTTPANVGDPVGGWKDKSNNANHVTQSTAASKPTVTTANFGGRRSLAWDGGDVILRTTFTQGTLAQPHTVYVVCFGSGVAEQVFDAVTFPTRWSMAFTSTTAGLFFDTSVVFSGAQDVRNPHVYCMVFTTTTGQIYQDNVLIGSGTPSSHLGMAGIRIGSNYLGGAKLTGGIGDLMCYGGTHTANQQTSMYNYLKTDWGTP